jgi:hypothetical protein
MNRILALGLFTFSVIAFAQAPQIKSGSTVYIEPMGGYETYLAAAILKRHVPVVVVIDKDKAAFILQGKVTHANLNSPAPAVVVNNTVNNGSQTQTPGNQVSQAMQQGYEEGAAERRALGMTLLSVSIISAQSSQVIFAASSVKDGREQLQKTSDDCAKHLKEFIEKSNKPKK